MARLAIGLQLAGLALFLPLAVTVVTSGGDGAAILGLVPVWLGFAIKGSLCLAASVVVAMATRRSAALAAASTTAAVADARPPAPADRLREAA